MNRLFAVVQHDDLTGDIGVPCTISAALTSPNDVTYFFKDEQYWKKPKNGQMSGPYSLLDWALDIVHCV